MSAASSSGGDPPHSPDTPSTPPQALEDMPKPQSAAIDSNECSLSISQPRTPNTELPTTTLVTTSNNSRAGSGMGAKGFPLPPNIQTRGNGFSNSMNNNNGAGGLSNNSFGGTARQRSSHMMGYQTASGSMESAMNRPYGHTHSTLAEIDEAFHLLGTNGDEVTAKELKPLLESLGQHPTDEDVQRLIRDVNPDGTIGFDDFASILGRHVELEDIDQMSSAFRWLDPEKTGYVDAKDFGELFSCWGEQSSAEEVDELLQFADPGGTGKIRYDEVLKMMAFRLR